jgi:hypothetical protein
MFSAPGGLFMDLTITLPSDIGVRVKEAAARQGLNAEEYVITALELALQKSTLDEILAPVRRQFAESELTEEELTALVKEERRAMLGERNGESQK